MNPLKRRAIAISDSSDGTTSLITHSFTTSKSSPPHFSPEDMGYPAEICTHPIGKDHPMTRLWKPELRLKVMDRVKRRADEWQAVDVFRRGWSSTAELCEATVLITVKEGTEVSDWTATVCDISDFCTKACGEPVQAELLLGSVVRQLGPMSEDMNWMGGSIGIEGSPDTGTLGGYLRLRRDGVITPVAMTCHHVFTSDPMPITPTSWSPQSVGVSQPSDKRHRAWVTSLEDTTAATKARMDEQDAVVGGSVGEKRRAAQLRVIDRNNTLLAEGRNCSRKFGHVFASSGFRVARHGCSLDWGLVVLNCGRVWTNKHRPDARRVSSDEFSDVSGTIRLKMGDAVIKTGADTQSTKGTFNHVESEVNFPGGPPTGTTEWCVIGDNDKRFSKTGDSGAWVLTEDGQLGGLVIGGTIAGTWSYVTPVEVIFKDIESSLSCTVELI